MHLDKTNGVGHAFLTIEKSNGSKMQRLSYGFYPKTENTWSMYSSVVSSIESAIGEEDKNTSRVSDIRYEIKLEYKDKDKFQKIIDKSIEFQSKEYHGAKYNCTDYAIQVFNSVLGDNHQLNVPNSQNAGYKTPSSLYNYLNNMRRVNGNNNIKNNTISPTKSTTCKVN